MEKIYLNDSYVKEWDARVVEAGDGWIKLDRTAFYPGGGGLPPDRGWIEWQGDKLEVKGLERDGKIMLDGAVPMGEEVRGILDWDYRYRIMRFHTAAHVLSAVFYEMGALMTGGQITYEKAREDFSLEEFSREKIEEAVARANEIIKEGHEVKIYFLPREEALKIEGIVKLRDRMPPDLKIWRIVEIEGVDIQADGGPHVRNTREIGEVKILKLENKGKGRRRLYYTISP